MGTEQEKGLVELPVFKEFITKSGLSVIPESIVKCIKERSPDITCELIDNGPVAFELVEICNSEIAEKISYVRSGGKFETLTVDNPARMIVCKKFRKDYLTDLPLELLCYTNGRTIATDDMLADEILSAITSYPSHIRFRRIWLLGEKGNVYKIWNKSEMF